jgi:hypothetical protein
MRLIMASVFMYWGHRLKISIALKNSLSAIDAHEHQVFDKLLWELVTSTIFVRC